MGSFAARTGCNRDTCSQAYCPPGVALPTSGPCLLQDAHHVKSPFCILTPGCKLAQLSPSIQLWAGTELPLLVQPSRVPRPNLHSSQTHMPHSSPVTGILPMAEVLSFLLSHCHSHLSLGEGHSCLHSAETHFLGAVPHRPGLVHAWQTPSLALALTQAGPHGASGSGETPGPAHRACFPCREAESCYPAPTHQLPKSRAP